MEPTDNDATAGLEPQPVEAELELEPQPVEPERELEPELPEPQPELPEPEPELPLVPAPRPERPQGMVPGRARRGTEVERVSMRVLATGGIIGIDVILGAVLVDQAVDGWIVGLVVGVTSVILAAVLWSSRQL
jgi:hypothetical protein